jgi:acyl-CoA thioesterase
MEDIRQFFEQDLFAKHCGIEILEVAPGRARAKMEIKPEHLNGVRVVQGGAVFTLADLDFALACNSHGTVAVAINVSITFMKGPRAGTLYAEAVEVARNPKLSHCDVKVTDENGELIATFQGLAYRKADKLEDVRRQFHR